MTTNTPQPQHLTNAVAMIVAALLAAIALTACGSSTSSTTSRTTSSTTTTSTTTGGSAQQRTAIQACLKKYGITLPTRPRTSTTTTSRTSTTPRPGAGVFGGGAGGSFFNNSKVQAALKECGITIGQRATTTNNVHNPAFQKAVKNYAACMSKNGYPLPKPNFSGNGPVFSTKQVNRNNPKFKAANTKCQPLLGRSTTTTNTTTTNTG
ncbi:MAG TPA: hypothetical protein VEF89_32155 [Solirubrobacteraceae bacterium]|nr:hypothetical protein [Solirubrobacteraceae bacterium]